MPPRRVRKRNTRMDAAIDHMIPYGFSEKLVRSTVKELLHAYGGDQGWPFIEDCSYRLLIDSLLEAGDEPEEIDLVQNGPLQEHAEEHAAEAMNLVEHAASDVVGPSNAAAEPISSEPTNIVPHNSSRDIVLSKSMDSELDEISGQSKTNSTIGIDKAYYPVIVYSAPEMIRPRQRAFYGWIESDEDEEEVDDFTFLPTLAVVEGATSNNASQHAI